MISYNLKLKQLSNKEMEDLNGGDWGDAAEKFGNALGELFLVGLETINSIRDGWNDGCTCNK